MYTGKTETTTHFRHTKLTIVLLQELAGYSVCTILCALLLRHRDIVGRRYAHAQGVCGIARADP